MAIQPRTGQPIGRHSSRLQRLRLIAAGQVPGTTLLDGVKLIADCAARGARITELYGTAGRLEELAATRPLAEVIRNGRAFALSEAIVDKLAPTRHSQGALAVVEVPHHAIAAAGVIVFLAGVQDPGNVGGVIRSAAAFAATGVACSPGCADPFSPRALRASAGNALFLPVTTGASFAELASAIHTAGGTVAGTAGAGGVPLHSWRPSPPVLVAFGNEGQGLSDDLRERCDAIVSIPIAPAVESLNVAVAAGVVLHALGIVRPPILD